MVKRSALSFSAVGFLTVSDIAMRNQNQEICYDYEQARRSRS